MLALNTLDLLTVSFIGGLLSLDNVAVLQTMLSQPIVAATLIGFLLDNTEIGLLIGVLLQFLWTSNVPAGAVVPPDNSVLACIGASAAILGAQFWNPSVAIFFSLVMTVVFAPITAWADAQVRQFNNQLALSADASALEGNFRAIPLKHLSGVLIFFLKGFILILSGTSLILLLEKGLLQVSSSVPFLTSEGFVRFARIFDTLFITLGIGSAIQLLRVSGRLEGFFAAFFLCSLLVEGLKLSPEASLSLAVLVPLVGQGIYRR